MESMQAIRPSLFQRRVDPAISKTQKMKIYDDRYASPVSTIPAIDMPTL
jgi:hypothetical protein